MSNKLGMRNELRELTDAELESVSGGGGFVYIGEINIGINFGQAGVVAGQVNANTVIGAGVVTARGAF
jgi:hypothetical protein